MRAVAILALALAGCIGYSSRAAIPPSTPLRAEVLSREVVFVGRVSAAYVSELGTPGWDITLAPDTFYRGRPETTTVVHIVDNCSMPVGYRFLVAAERDGNGKLRAACGDVRREQFFATDIANVLKIEGSVEVRVGP